MTSPKLLTLRETLEIYFIVSPHIPKEYITHYDACSKIFDGLSAEEYLNCITILTGLDRKEIIVSESLTYFMVFIEGLRINNILSLPNLFKKMGFI